MRCIETARLAIRVSVVWRLRRRKPPRRLLALGSPGLTVVMPGKEAIALAPLSVSVLDQFEKLSDVDSAHSSTQTAAHGTRSTRHPSTGSGWHHPRMTHQASRASGERPRIACSRS